MKGLRVPLINVGITAIVIGLAIWFNLLGLGEGIEIIILLWLVFVTAQYANSAAKQVKVTQNLVDETKRSLSQAARASLDVVRTEHNWKLFEYEVDPGLPGLPSLAKDKEYWKWRMTHLDHLSLLHTQWKDREAKAIDDEEINSWMNWAQLLLGEFQKDRQEAITKLRDKEPGSEPDTRKIMESEETSSRLKALLHISELHNWDIYPCDFVKWLREKCNFESLGLSEKKSLEKE